MRKVSYLGTGCESVYREKWAVLTRMSCLETGSTLLNRVLLSNHCLLDVFLGVGDRKMNQAPNKLQGEAACAACDKGQGMEAQSGVRLDAGTQKALCRKLGSLGRGDPPSGAVVASSSPVMRLTSLRHYSLCPFLKARFSCHLG